MLQSPYYVNLLLTILTAITSVDGSVPYLNKDVFNKNIRSRFSFVENLRKTQTFSDGTKLNLSIINNSVTEPSHFTKWQVGRISRKQYEVLNMIWKKTKELSNKKRFKPSSYGSNLSAYATHPRQVLTPATPSFIEFYYLDDTTDRKMNSSSKYQLTKGKQYKNSGKFRSSGTNHHVFVFRVNYPNFIRGATPTKQLKNLKTMQSTKMFRLPLHEPINSVTNQKTSNRITYNTSPKKVPGSGIKKRTCHSTEPITSKDNLNVQSDDGVLHNWSKPPTIYDRIRFFEKYDRHTPSPYKERRKKFLYLYDMEKETNDNKISVNQKFLSENKKPKHVKNQHIKREKPNYLTKPDNFRNKLGDTNALLSDSPTKSSNIQISDNYVRTLPYHKSTLPHSKNMTSNIALWSDYSFMAVYVYEPSQVYCDAAGISPHWLVTSGSCLSRHHKNLGRGGRSAFVAFCGSSWWNSERISYVKYSVVHPNFQRRDKNRRYLYNIGLIQVVTSMHTCIGWKPVQLMSHRFTTGPEGTIAYAIGWGLDRFTSTELPRYPLMMYSNLAFSDSCPGNRGYSSLKNNEESGTKNVYCLTLPPYFGEKYDPIHGSILTMNGKLCGTYLQEERRSSGQQCAEYTGIWRLGPWVTRVAKEPDTSDSFTFAM